MHSDTLHFCPHAGCNRKIPEFVKWGVEQEWKEEQRWKCAKCSPGPPSSTCAPARLAGNWLTEMKRFFTAVYFDSLSPTQDRSDWGNMSKRKRRPRRSGYLKAPFQMSVSRFFPGMFHRQSFKSEGGGVCVRLLQLTWKRISGESFDGW